MIATAMILSFWYEQNHRSTTISCRRRIPATCTILNILSCLNTWLSVDSKLNITNWYPHNNARSTSGGLKHSLISWTHVNWNDQFEQLNRIHALHDNYLFALGRQTQLTARIVILMNILWVIELLMIYKNQKKKKYKNQIRFLVKRKKKCVTSLF